MKNFLRKYGHVWILGYFSIYIPWFIHLEKTVTRHYYVIHSVLDDFIPFNEYFVIPYFLWFLYVAAAIVYFFFTEKEDYYKLCIFLFVGMTVSLLVCSVFKNGTNFRPMIDPDKNLCSALVATLYKTDTCTNVFPSIHAYNSIGTHIAVMKSESLKRYPWVQRISCLLMVSICMATVFLKQHSIIDVVGAVLLCCAVYPPVYAIGERVGKKRPEGAWTP